MTTCNTPIPNAGPRTVMIVLIIVLVCSGSGCTVFNPKGQTTTPEIERTEWVFEITQMNQLNTLGYYGAGVLVGVVDTGVDLSHPDLKDLELKAWQDEVNGEPEPYDDNGHGTHIIGILAADGKLRGAAPAIELVVIKAIGSDGSGSDENVANGIRFCIDAGVDILLLSLGGDQRIFNIGDATARACSDAVDSGIVVVSSAGNDGTNDDGDVSSPAHIEGVIAVGAIDQNKNIAPFSSKGDNEGRINPPWPWMPDPDDRKDPDKKPEIVAPGVAIVSTYLDKTYAKSSGTSQAAAVAAGVLALVLTADPSAVGGDANSITNFKTNIMNSCEKCPGQQTPHNDHYGYGLIKGLDLLYSL